MILNKLQTYLRLDYTPHLFLLLKLAGINHIGLAREANHLAGKFLFSLQYLPFLEFTQYEVKLQLHYDFKPDVGYCGEKSLEFLVLPLLSVYFSVFRFFHFFTISDLWENRVFGLLQSNLEANCYFKISICCSFDLAFKVYLDVSFRDC